MKRFWISISHFLFLILLAGCKFPATNASWTALATGVGAIGAAFYSGYFYLECKLTECCDEPYINANVYRKLQLNIEENLYGQPLAMDTILRAVSAHAAKKNPNKALVMSFHGWTGSGKNHLAKMIANAIYQKGMHSKYVHLMVSTLSFPHVDELKKYKTQLRAWIRGNLTKCERSLFIFDEMDKMPIKLMDEILPFIDFYDHIDGVNPRKSIFLFLSNSGGTAIAERTLSYYNAGRAREEIPFKEMEAIIKESAYNEGDGGLKMSRLISKHLIDYFVPFLPLERKHVIMCFKDYMRRKNIDVLRNTKLMEELADSLHYFPKVNPLFSVSGCKHVEQKVDYKYWERLKEKADDEL